ncbi:hypothetical protein LR48_Vigan11g099200 [Vigna angularis]|uniref:Uncharacterized protein n=1 Tax=Phaseolus angularis TaxID=3914 RepID=A0A0L9VT94_PHAAN|nr:hypothetical protein LR48_Vigan11g099200 [Vigna angularis]
MAGNDEISQIYRSGPTSARKDPSSIPNVSEAIASLNSTLEANSPREKRRCFFAPRLRRGQSSEPSLLTLEEVTPCFLLIGDLGLMTAVLCGAKERERERLVESLHLENVVGEEDFRGWSVLNGMSNAGKLAVEKAHELGVENMTISSAVIGGVLMGKPGRPYHLGSKGTEF